MSVTFNVDPVKATAAPTNLLRTVNFPGEIASGVNADVVPAPRNIKSMMQEATDKLSCGEGHTNGFLQAVHRAYMKHIPLTLSPDDVWLAIAQGFAIHVRENAEALRARFVQHEGQKELVVRRDSFHPADQTHNSWPGVIAEFSEKVSNEIGAEKRRLVVADFSTTGNIERTATEVVLLDAMSRYFGYTLVTRCGIPTITLTGGAADWKDVRARARVFAEYGCSSWIEALEPVLDQFCAAAEGRPSKSFWRAIYKHENMSGGPTMSGHLRAFFPYLASVDRKTKEVKYRVNESLRQSNASTKTGDVPGGVAEVPFTWNYLGTKIEMAFHGGFLGVCGEGDAVRPAIGWAVSQKG